MSTKFQTLCRKPYSIRLRSSEDMSGYVTEFKNTNIPIRVPILTEFITACDMSENWYGLKDICHGHFIFICVGDCKFTLSSAT